MRRQRKYQAAAAACGSLAAVIGAVLLATTDNDQPRCTAEITVYEDGTWQSGQLKINDATVTEQWDAATLGWRPRVGSVACTIVIK